MLFVPHLKRHHTVAGRFGLRHSTTSAARLLHYPDKGYHKVITNPSTHHDPLVEDGVPSYSFAVVIGLKPSLKNLTSLLQGLKTK